MTPGASLSKLSLVDGILRPVMEACAGLICAGLVFGGCSGCSDDAFERGADLGVSSSPGAVVFGTVAVGAIETVEVTISHVGETGTLELQPAQLLDATADLSVSGPLVLELGPGESTTLTVSYAPSDGVYDSGTLVVEHNVVEQPPIIIGVQTVLQTPRLTSVPPVIEFGAQSAGTDAHRDVKIRNTGSLEVTVETMGLDLELGAPFELLQPPTLPRVLAVGEELSVRVGYHPDVTGTDTAHNARLRLRTDHAATDNRYVIVRGTARHQRLAIHPGLVNFGWVPVGEVAIEDVVLLNEGLDALTVNAASLADASPGLTLLGLPEPPFELQPGEALSVTLRFAPESAVGAPDVPLATLVLQTSDYVIPDRSVSIFGQGAEPVAAIVPEEVVDLGVVAIGYQHARKVRVLNLGTGPLTVTSVTVGDESSEGFSVLASPELPVVLAPLSGVAELRVAYTNPGLPDGVSWGELVVGTDDPVAPNSSVSLRARNASTAHCLPRFDPPQIGFGAVGYGSKKELSFNLVNDGSLPCTYQSSSFLDCQQPEGLCQPIFGGSAVFSLGSAPPTKGKRVFFGDSIDIPVWYEPNAESGTDAAITVLTLIDGTGDGPFIQHHSPAGGSLPTLSGTVGTSGLVAKPVDISFSLTTIGCGAKPADVSVTRLGAKPIALAKVDSSSCGGAFVYHLADPLPVPVYEDPAAAVSMQVQFAPTVPGFVECTLELGSDDPEAGPAVVTISGVGTAEELRTDFYQQVPESKVDILFVVDNSGSMGDEQDTLVAGFDGFIEKASVWDVKYRIGVITTDVKAGQGHLVGYPTYVTNENPAPFKANALVGIKGSGNERGLHTAWLALQPTALAASGPNAGFLRDDALLAIIWISDEDEGTKGTPVQSYVDFFKGLKPPGKLKGYAIVGDQITEDAPIGGCGGYDGSATFGGPDAGAEPGTRYIEAAGKLNGFWHSICAFGKEGEDEAPLLEQIGEDAFQPILEFPLSVQPDPTTIVVEVDGSPCEDGWSHDAEKNVVLFALESTCLPGPDASLKFIYKPICYPLVGTP